MTVLFFGQSEPGSFQLRLMPPTYVKAYVKRNKHDVADAEAICEAVRRPSMRFVPSEIKGLRNRYESLHATRRSSRPSTQLPSGDWIISPILRTEELMPDEREKKGKADRDRVSTKEIYAVLWRKPHKQFKLAFLCRSSQTANSNFSPACGHAGAGSI
jgi:hypothetical protein